MSFKRGSFPALNRSRGVSQEVSAARCHRAPGGAGQTEIDRISTGIEHQAKCALLIFMDQTCKLFFFGSVQLGNPPCGPNQWISASV